MNNWQVGRITFGSKDKSGFHGMDGDVSIIARIARRLSLSRSGEIKQGDVILPTKSVENMTTLTAKEVVDLTYQAVRYGENISEVVEDIANRLGYFGGCEPDQMNGDVCIKKKCRQCFVGDLKNILALAVLKDTKDALAEHVISKSTRIAS